jgi:hypothetical protein
VQPYCCHEQAEPTAAWQLLLSKLACLCTGTQPFAAAAAALLTSSQPLLCPTHMTQKFCASFAMLRMVSSRWCLVWPSSAATVYKLPMK